MLYDSDIIIWRLRGHRQASTLIEEDPERSISAVTYIEVIRGLRNKEHLQKWNASLARLQIKIIQINESISTKAMYWVEEFSLSHGLELADSLIASTAVINGLTLVTANNQDYRYLPNLNLKIFKE